MRRTRRAGFVAAIVLGAGCAGGGGGGSGDGPESLALDFGLVASTVETVRSLAVDNPFEGDAVATAGPGSGPFAMAPSFLPTSVPGGGSVVVDVVFTPAGPGLAAGTLSLRFVREGGAVEDVAVEATAEAEPVTLALLTPTLAFGEVAEGDAKVLPVRVRNDSTRSPATLSVASTPPEGFSLPAGALPVTLAPGATGEVPVRCAPGAVGPAGGTLSIGSGEPGGPLVVTLLASTGGEVVVEFGPQGLDAFGRTPLLRVDVPADAISLTLEGTMPGAVVGLGECTGPGGRVYENVFSTGAYVWIPGEDVFSTTLPNTDRAEVQLVPGGGEYAFRLQRRSGFGSSMSVRAIVERRPGATGAVGRLDLDVWLANAIAPKAATAAGDARLQEVLDAVDTILQASGIRLGDVRYHDVTNPAFDDVTEAEFGPMLATTASAPSPRLNLFFVRTAFGGGVLGVAATIAGPKVNGTTSSGVMSLYDGWPAATIGLVAAHEIGHFLGLYHTVEQTGEHDFVDDTPECPAVGTNAACTTAGGGLLLHWQAVGGTAISPGQGAVIRGHPHVEADFLPTGSLLLLRRGDLARPLALGGDPLPDGWCGTCVDCAK
jgi:hypothetical protein